MEQDREVGLAQIERGHFFLPDGQLKSKIKCKNVWEILLMKMVFKNSPSWSTVAPIRFKMTLYPALPSLKWWKPQVSSSFHCRLIQKIPTRLFLKRAIVICEHWKSILLPCFPNKTRKSKQELVNNSTYSKENKLQYVPCSNSLVYFFGTYQNNQSDDIRASQ
jgi:hypothetical protein